MLKIGKIVSERKCSHGSIWVPEFYGGLGTRRNRPSDEELAWRIMNNWQPITEFYSIDFRKKGEFLVERSWNGSFEHDSCYRFWIDSKKQIFIEVVGVVFNKPFNFKINKPKNKVFLKRNKKRCYFRESNKGK